MKTARLAGFYVALAAMLFRAFLPDGWMPAPPSHNTGAAWAPFVICTANGLAERGDAHGSSQHDDDHEQRYAPCAYAAAAHLASPEMGVAVAIYDAAFLPAPLDAASDLPLQRELFARERSRAPPFLTI
ncbi:hypothetical protein F2P47_05640 [Parvibaculum sedimenti]|uniref:DUF2946 domain-containing protein n=1 Tax=Parvibaculum sedimenti TaxID=2608632 RepID=A0A6N6VN96_9HYPH|nr:hypothetical protein [Parvibaculum sedimenti]KAB7741228.1 hypothetical protein F2P47_05640 [Parvibaculum sedimenti]